MPDLPLRLLHAFLSRQEGRYIPVRFPTSPASPVKPLPLQYHHLKSRTYTGMDSRFEAPGRYQKDYLLPSLSTDWITQPGKYHLHKYIPWLSQPSCNNLLYRLPDETLLLKPVAGSLPVLRFGSTAPSLLIPASRSYNFLPDHLPVSHL